MSFPRSARLTATALALATAGVGLAGCGSGSSGNTASKGSTPTASPTSGSTSAAANPCNVPSGATSDAVKVTGAFGKQQKATFKKPLKAYDLERSVIKKGSGAPTQEGDQVSVLVTVYTGTGTSLGSSPLNVTVGDSSIPTVFTTGAACLPIGSRTVSTALASDVYGPQGNPQAHIKGTDTLVVVSDLLSKRKQVKPAAWTKDKPTVTFDKSGKPTVKLPHTAPPKTLEEQVLKQGNGPVVKSGDSVTVDYQGTSWNTGKIFDQSYGRSPATFGTDQVVQGFGAAMIGQKVGSRLVVSIPPKYAYGPKAKKGSGNQLAGQTLVFVIDIKSTKSNGS